MASQKLNYGNWIRRRIVNRFLLTAIVLFLLALLPIPLFVRIILVIFACVFLSGFLYLAYIYFQFSDEGGNFQRKLWQLVLDHLTWDGKGQALDIGTGNGTLAIGLALKYPNASTIGIDLWADDWEYSQSICENNARIEHLEGRVHFQQASAASLPFTDEAFDAVVSHFVFHEVRGASTIEVLREAFRVLRKGGAFSFQDMFLDKTLYTEIPTLVSTIREWGVEEVRFIPCHELLAIPSLLRHRRVLGNAGLIVGRK